MKFTKYLLLTVLIVTVSKRLFSAQAQPFHVEIDQKYISGNYYYESDNKVEGLYNPAENSATITFQDVIVQTNAGTTPPFLMNPKLIKIGYFKNPSYQEPKRGFVGGPLKNFTLWGVPKKQFPGSYNFQELQQLKNPLSPQPFKVRIPSKDVVKIMGFYDPANQTAQIKFKNIHKIDMDKEDNNRYGFDHTASYLKDHPLLMEIGMYDNPNFSRATGNLGNEENQLPDGMVRLSFVYLCAEPDNLADKVTTKTVTLAPTSTSSQEKPNKVYSDKNIKKYDKQRRTVTLNDGQELMMNMQAGQRPSSQAAAEALYQIGQ
jgi:hypothetical protein